MLELYYSSTFIKTLVIFFKRFKELKKQENVKKDIEELTTEDF